MSLGATMSILGLYSFDNTVFDLMSFPDGFTNTQKEIVTNNILVECAELEFLYPNPTVAKNIIAIWSAKEKPYWDRVFAAAQLEYNPIENYRRNEEESISDGRTEEHTGKDTRSYTGQETTSGTGESTDSESGTDTTTNKVTGYDSNDFVNHDSSAISYGHKNTNTANATSTITHNTADTINHGEKITHGGTTDRKTLAYGNIGVTTSQDMLTAEMEVAKIIQVIPIIIESFKNRFCLLVY